MGWSGCAGNVNNVNNVNNTNNSNVCTGAAPLASLQAGVCAAHVKVCEEGIWVDPDYTAIPAYEATETLCDGLDNDCNGEVDEGCDCIHGEIQACGSSVGLCTEGQQECVQGQWGACIGGTEPTLEICDGLDNDCDGSVDDNPIDVGLSCATGLPGACAVGLLECWSDPDDPLVCVPDVNPGEWEEICDGIDNNCDGLIDNDEMGDPLTSNCYDGPPGTVLVGICQAGFASCSGGHYGACVGQVLPSVARSDHASVL